ncbi:hypothetical protein J1N35_000968 [Gossypium stocksii]|uniref:Uncharacterized protein n=1 Tax=Gossypium stocksii TaxID=47602 RepID=A0A9D3WIN4_9ROSI|nr:hypothetical protein J1N35_000968 [Gossypium stocksii]
MAFELIRLDPKHISIEQMRMWMGSLNLLIGVSYATSFWVLFRIELTEFRSRWAGYETYSRSQMMILLN